MVAAVIVGAGEGSRMGGGTRKQFTKIDGKPIFAYTIDVFEASPRIDHIVAVVPRDLVEWMKKEVIEAYGFKKVYAVVGGGETRQESVLRGLEAVKPKTEFVIVHDAVRPLVNQALIDRVLDAAQKTGAAVTAVPARDTVKQVESGQVVGTLDRRLLWLSQTPQCFRYDLLLDAHRKASTEKFESTDDASLVEHYGVKVMVAVGSYANLKITSPEDLPLFEYFLKQQGRQEVGKHPRERRRDRRPRSRRARARRQ